MLDGEYLPGFGEVEHIKNDRFGASVLTTVDRADYFNQHLAFMESALFTVLADNGQFSLLDDAVVDCGMMMPTGNGSDRERHA